MEESIRKRLDLLKKHQMETRLELAATNAAIAELSALLAPPPVDPPDPQSPEPVKASDGEVQRG